MRNQAGARFIARNRGTLENQYADDIRTESKQSVLTRIKSGVVRRKRAKLESSLKQ